MRHESGMLKEYGQTQDGPMTSSARLASAGIFGPALPGRIDLSVIIPMYQEQARIRATVADLVEWLSKQDFTSEVVLVNDGSKDNTEEVVQPFLGPPFFGPIFANMTDAGALQAVRLIRHLENRGKGAAVRTGLASSIGRWRLMMDADNAATIREVIKLAIVADKRQIPFVVGSRNAPDAEVIAVSHRKLSGLIYRAALRVLGLAAVSDTQCGFKLYRDDFAALVTQHAKEDGFVFDIEHLLIARKNGYRIAEVGVKWVHQDGGTVSPVRDGLKMLSRAFMIRLRSLGPTPPPSKPAASIEIKPLGAAAESKPSTAVLSHHSRPSTVLRRETVL